MNHNRRMASRWTAFVVWALMAGAVMFWVLRLGVRPQAMPAAALAVTEGVEAHGDLSKLLGASAVAPTSEASDPGLSSRFKLTGVMAPKAREGELASSSSAGIALLMVDGKPARPYRTGARIDGDLFLLSVGQRTASVGHADGPLALVLELPVLAPPATGSLPDIPSGAESAAPSPNLTPASEQAPAREPRPMMGNSDLAR